MGKNALLERNVTTNVCRSKRSNRFRGYHALTPRRVAQARLGIELGRAYLMPQGRGKLRTITEKEYEHLKALTDLARADGGFTHAVYWHTISEQRKDVTKLRRLVRIHDLGRGPKETLYV